MKISQKNILSFPDNLILKIDEISKCECNAYMQ